MIVTEIRFSNGFLPDCFPFSFHSLVIQTRDGYFFQGSFIRTFVILNHEENDLVEGKQNK